MKHEIPLMQAEGGAIVNTSSGAGGIGIAGQAGYAAAKWGVIGLTKSAALEYVDAGIPIAAPAGSSEFAAALVHFTPGARTAWHTHSRGQTISVTEGVGRCQRESGPVESIRPGDRVVFEPGENHWHGAAPNRFTIHIAMQQNDHTGEGGRAVSWGEHVTDQQYGAYREPS